MAYTIKERLAKLNKNTIKKMSLHDMYKKYGFGDLLKEEIEARKTTNFSEVYNFFKNDYPLSVSIGMYPDYSSVVEFDYFVNFLGVPAIEVLNWDRIYSISYTDSLKYFSDNLEWISNNKLVSKISKKFIREFLLNNDNYVKYPELLEAISALDLENIINLIDISKISNFTRIYELINAVNNFDYDLMLDRAIANNNSFAIAKLIENQCSKHYVSKEQLIEMLKKLKEKLSYSDFVDVFINISSNIHIALSDSDIDIIFSIEELKKMIEIKNFSNINPKIGDKILKNFGSLEVYEALEKNDNILLKRRLLDTGIDMNFISEEFKKKYPDMIILLEFFKNYSYREFYLIKDFIINNLESLNITDKGFVEKINIICGRLFNSNSEELNRIASNIALELIKKDNYLEYLDRIEQMFLKNNIPMVGKIYSVFDTLHPNCEGFNFNNSMVSPVLKEKGQRGRNIVIFSDLIKASLGSNNRSFINYINNLEEGNKLFIEISNGVKKIEELNSTEKNILVEFCKHLSTLYNYSNLKKESDYSLTGNLSIDLQNLKEKFSTNGNLDYDLSDRVIKMFCHFAGIDTLEEAKAFLIKKINDSEKRNLETGLSDMRLSTGDFVKGIGGINYLGNILQNGSVSKEFLGSSSGSDLTPLDTDVSMILNGTTNEEMINSTEATAYGPIWFVLKNDDRFIITRDHLEGEKKVSHDLSKLEVFYTGAVGRGHYGIRTGFASSDINYIVVENEDKRINVEIAKNGFYIPVANKQGKIIFTPQQYFELRQKMQGLSNLGVNKYEFSQQLISPEVNEIHQQVSQNIQEVSEKKEKILKVIRNALEEAGLTLKLNIDGDLTPGSVELIDTGSTGRHTNMLGDGDFDFIMRLDKDIISDSQKLNQLKAILLKHLNVKFNNMDDFRLKDVKIEDIMVDIDISFARKTDKLTYSTDMALQDRLETIKQIDPQKYDFVLSNIILAKKILKEASAYKPARSDITQGGLGGVGVENWILQNGGSFEEAVINFLNCAYDKNFDEFKKDYQIWDFGENHLAQRRGHYIHDDFVNNMNEPGYNKMKKALLSYYKEHILPRRQDLQNQFDNQLTEVLIEEESSRSRGSINLLNLFIVVLTIVIGIIIANIILK